MKLRSKIFYGFGAFGKDLMYAMSTIMAIFFVDYIGINPGFIGIMFMVARIWDAVNDPIMGTIVDNTKSKRGKFKPWILIGSLINSVVLVMVFLNPDLAPDSFMMYVYVSTFYILWGMSYTLMDIPFWSMIPTFSKDQKVREQITVIARVGAQVGFAVIAAGYVAFVTMLGGGNGDAEVIKGFLMLSIIVSVVFAISQIGLYFFVEENQVEDDNEEKLTLKGMFNLLKQNDQLLVVAVVIVLFNFVLYVTSNVAFYYIKYDVAVQHGLEYDGLMTQFLAVGFLVQLIAMGTYGIFSKLMKRKTVFQLSIWISIGGFIASMINTFLLGNQLVLMFVFAGVIFFGIGLIIVSQTVLLTDTVDYGEWKIGRRSESSVFSAQTFVVKLATGLSMGLVGLGLVIFDYDAALTVQSDFTVVGIRLLMFGLPVIGMLIALYIFRTKHTLDEEKYAIVVKELEERK
jgi:melibiose permease